MTPNQRANIDRIKAQNNREIQLHMARKNDHIPPFEAREAMAQKNPKPQLTEAQAETVINASYKPPLTFARLQLEHSEWANRNFGRETDEARILRCYLGASEEMGELAHALLKQHQGIRGSFEQHEAAAKNAVGDVIIYLSDLCSRKGWSLQQIMEATWDEVKARDWTKNKETGQVAP